MYPPGTEVISTVDGTKGVVIPWEEAQFLIELDSRFSSTPPKSFCFDCHTTADGYVVVRWNEGSSCWIQDVRYLRPEDCR